LRGSAVRAERGARAGRGKVTTLAQSKSYLKPLFSKLKKKDMEADILEKMFLIVQHCKKREYTKAGDQYILLSIGKAAWPMGVTSVGIHERSAPAGPALGAPARGRRADGHAHAHAQVGARADQPVERGAHPQRRDAA
jgi:hypothetical protein